MTKLHSYQPEERVIRILRDANRLVIWHFSIRLDTVFEAVQLPTGIAHLNARLADMETDDFTLLN